MDITLQGRRLIMLTFSDTLVYTSNKSIRNLFSLVNTTLPVFTYAIKSGRRNNFITLCTRTDKEICNIERYKKV